jgi:hypothetical protein
LGFYSDLGVAEDEIVAVVGSYWQSGFAPHVVDPLIGQAKDESPSWLLGLIGIDWIGSVSSDDCAIADLDEDDEIRNQIKVFVEVNRIQGVILVYELTFKRNFSFMLN